MKNVYAEIVNGKMVIEIDLAQSFGPSKSGKTEIIATTEGNSAFTINDNETVFLGLNLYKYAARG